MVGVEFWWLGLVIVLNASFSSIDLFGAIYIQLSVPKNSDVCNQGWSTYWCARRIKRVKDAYQSLARAELNPEPWDSLVQR